MKKLNNIERQSVSFLDVPFSEKDEVHNMGAIWDDIYRKWYVPLDLDVQKFSKWFGTTPDFNLHRSPLNNPRLFIDLVPKTSWAHNLSQQLPTGDWDKVRKAVYAKANNVCEICGCVGPKGRLDAHERWHYNEQTNVQTLTDISALCPNCHMSSHMGFAKIQKKEHIAMAHLAWINLWTAEECIEHAVLAFATWRTRSQNEWATDVSWLFSNNIPLSNKVLNILKEENSHWFIDKSKIK